MGSFARLLLVMGAALLLVGFLLLLLERFPGWRIGRLPGDIVIQRGNWRFIFPLATSLLVSLLLTLLLWLFTRR